MLSFREVLFFKNFSYSFCFRLDDFKRPLVIQGFWRVFFNRDSFERKCKIGYTWENFHEIFIGIVGVRYWIQVPPIHFRQNISEFLNQVCIYYSVSYCYFFIVRIKSVFHRNSKNWKMVRIICVVFCNSSRFVYNRK